MMVMQVKRLQQFCYILPVLAGIGGPMLKVVNVALTQKLMLEILRQSLDPDLLEEIDSKIFGTVRGSPVTRFLLMESLTFYENLVVCACLIVIMSMVQPLKKTLEHYLEYMEVKRLQTILFQKFVVESNTMATKEANDLLFTKMALIEKYIVDAKYRDINAITALCFSLFLFIILAWDLGLISLGAAIFIFFISKMVWWKLSTPWAEQREQKTAYANAQLLDLVTCKEVIVSQATENEERIRLQQALDSDRTDIRHICLAFFCSEVILVSVFSVIAPLLFLIVYVFDPTMKRLFQLLIMIIVLEEMTRAFLMYIGNGPIREEYQRAKAKFCQVLGLDEEVLFPPDFPWLHRQPQDVAPKQENTTTPVDDSKDHESTDDSMETGKVVTNDQDDFLNEDLATSIEMALQNPSPRDCISLEGIAFGYTMVDGSTFQVVDNLNLSLALRTHYAIMGETGAGKSTIFKGLSGLIKPLKGQFTVAGKVIHPRSSAWRKQMGIVNQTSILLNRTLRENLCYGIGHRSDEEIFEALEKVNMKARVLMLPDGLDNLIRDNGNEFSGGQRQRLQIARLLLTSCQVVLLDEFTSALDSETTADVLNVMKSFIAGKTLIMISHDVQTLCLAQRILDMKVGGKIVEATKTRRSTLRQSIRSLENMPLMEEDVEEDILLVRDN